MAFRARLAASAAVLLAFALPSPAGAVVPTGPASTWIPDGEVEAVVTSGNTAWIGGNFGRIGPYTGASARFDAASGNLSTAPWPVVEGVVEAVADDGSGGWYLGGLFSRVGGEPRTNLAHVLADGTLDPNWTPTTNGRVRTLESTGSSVFVGGSFTQVNGTARTYAAEVDSTGALTSFAPMISMASPQDEIGVYDIALGSALTLDRPIYLVGEFDAVTGASGGVTTRHHAVAIGHSTGNVHNWNPDTSRVIRSIALYPGNTIFLGGSFTTVAGQSRRGIAQVNTTNGALTSWALTGSEGGSVRSLAVLSASDSVYVSGSIQQGTTLYPNAAFSATDGSARTGWRPPDTGVRAITTAPGRVYLGGATTFGPNTLVGVDPVNAAVQVEMPLGRGSEPSPGTGKGVRAIGVRGTEVVAGGSFENAGGVSRKNLAAIDLTTGRPTDFDAPMNGMFSDLVDVKALALTSDGLLWAGGNFYTEAPGERHSLAAFDATSGAQASFDHDPANGSQEVFALAASGNTVYVGGGFTGLEDTPNAQRNNLAAVRNVPGERGTILPFDADINGDVKALALRGSTLYAGGQFDEVNSGLASHRATRRFLAAFDPASGDVLPWNPDADNRVLALAATDDTVYAGGDFTSVAGGATSRGGLAAFEAGGSGAPRAWDPGGADGPVRALAVHGPTVLAGGEFSSVGGASHARLAALDAVTGVPDAFGLDSVADQATFATNPPIVPRVDALAVAAGSRLIAGGTFLTHSPQPLLVNLAVFGLPELPAPPAPGGGDPPGGGGPPGGGPPATPPVSVDRLAPGLTAFAATRKTFRVGPGATASNGNAVAAGKKKATPKGTTLTLTLNEAAKVKLEVLQRTTGRRVGKKCVKPTKKNAKKKKCTRLVAKGSFSRNAKLGKSKIAWSGKIGRKALKPGKYTVRATPTDAAGNKGKARTLNVKIVRR